MNALLGLGMGIVIFFIISLLITALFLWIGATLAGIKGASFGKAILTALLSVIGLTILGVFLSFIPFMGDFLGLLLGVLLSIFIIKAVFDTSWGKALSAWIFYVIAVMIAFFITLLSGFLFFSSMF